VNDEHFIPVPRYAAFRPQQICNTACVSPRDETCTRVMASSRQSHRRFKEVIRRFGTSHMRWRCMSGMPVPPNRGWILH